MPGTSPAMTGAFCGARSRSHNFNFRNSQQRHCSNSRHMFATRDAMRPSRAFISRPMEGVGPDGRSEIFLQRGLDTPVRKPPDRANHRTAARANSTRVPDAVQRPSRCSAEPGPIQTPSTMDPGSAAHHIAKSGALRSIRRTTGVRRYSKVDGWPGIGERKRRRPSDGYGRAEATPSFGRLRASGSDVVIRTAMPGHDQREIAICSRLHSVAQIPSSKCKSSQQGRGALADFKVPREIRFRRRDATLDTGKGGEGGIAEDVGLRRRRPIGNISFVIASASEASSRNRQ
jgi:hypothetical protein